MRSQEEMSKLALSPEWSLKTPDAKNSKGSLNDDSNFQTPKQANRQLVRQQVLKAPDLIDESASE